jgi:two-component system chemotaxis response regulator CheB
MLEAQGEAVEKALWTAVRSLEERAILIGKLAENARGRGHDGVAALFNDRSLALGRDVEMLRDLIGRGRALEPVGQDGA